MNRNMARTPGRRHGFKLGNQFLASAGAAEIAVTRHLVVRRPPTPLQMGEMGGWGYAQACIRTRVREGTRKVTGNG